MIFISECVYDANKSLCSKDKFSQCQGWKVRSKWLEMKDTMMRGKQDGMRETCGFTLSLEGECPNEYS